MASLLAACSDTESKRESTPDHLVTDPRGWAVDQPGLFGPRRDARASGPESPSGSDLGSIGYAPGSEAPTAETGVRVNEAARTAPGLNLMCFGDEAAAVLCELDGTVVRRWAYPYGSLPGAPDLEGPHQIPWRRVQRTSDGGLLAIHSGRAIVSLDADSRLRWVSYVRAHHDIALDEAGDRVYVLARTERVVPAVTEASPIVDDLIVTFDLEGKELARLSLWDAFESSEFAAMLEALTVREGDVMHVNSLERLSEAAASSLGIDAVKGGHFLVCMRDLDLVAAVDLGAGKLVWVSQGPPNAGPLRGPWRAPHDPTVTAAGEILIFDNRGGIGESSRLLAIDPATGTLRWSWPDPTKPNPPPFESFFCGTVQELANGNLLAAESTRGRALEIDRATGDIVWEFVSDRLAGPRDEFVAALFSIERLAAGAADEER